MSTSSSSRTGNCIHILRLGREEDISEYGGNTIERFGKDEGQRPYAMDVLRDCTVLFTTYTGDSYR